MFSEDGKKKSIENNSVQYNLVGPNVYVEQS